MFPEQESSSQWLQRTITKDTSRRDNLALQKPQFREFSFETKVFERYSRVGKALINAINRIIPLGVSTRKVRDIISQLGLDQLSASSVSRISKELDETVEEFLKRPIEQEMLYLFVDASYFKVRTESRFVTKAFLVITGVREDGYREILGARIE